MLCDEFTADLKLGKEAGKLLKAKRKHMDIDEEC